MTVPQIVGFATPATMSEKARRPDYLVDDMLESRVLALLFGDPGSGKSFLALDWACSIASGQPWCGRAVRQGSVVYIAGEGHSGINRRVLAWCKHHNVSPETLPLYVTQQSYNFQNSRHLDFLRDRLEEVPEPVRLIVVDTIARAMPEMNEDRANEMSPFVGVCDGFRDTFRATVLLIHHSPHGDKTRAKGSIALKGAVDFEVGLMRTADDDVVKLVSTKLKDGEPLPDTFLRFHSVPIDDGATSAVLVQVEPPQRIKGGSSRKVKLTANDKLLLLALGTAPIDEATVRENFLAKHPGDNPDNAAKNYRRAVERAGKRQWFTREGAALIPSTEAMLEDRQPGQGGQ